MWASIDSAINSLSASGGTSFLSAIGQTASFLQTSVNDKDNYVIFLSDGDSADTPRSSDVDYVKNKAKVFIVPSGNYDEALKLKEKNNYDIELIKADNLHNVIENLKNR